MSAEPAGQVPKIAVVVVAYNAESTLRDVLDRVPVDFRERIQRVYVCDDASTDDTYQVGLDYYEGNPDYPLTVIRHDRNLGYGGNQKAGYARAIADGMDIVVLLHGDGQYAPECLPDMVAPLERGEADAVFGSRMMVRRAALEGGMPLYKYVGNRILTRFENAVLGTNLSEFHSGYRAYSTAALRRIDIAANSDGFDFDTEIIIRLVDAGYRITEIPIPTYYGDEICRVNGMQYAWDVCWDVMTWRLNRMGLGRGRFTTTPDEYEWKDDDTSSHAAVLRMAATLAPCKILDVGCSGGELARRLRDGGHHVTGIDVAAFGSITENCDEFIAVDLDVDGAAALHGRHFDLLVAADVLEHVREPEQRLGELVELLSPGGHVVISLPNFSHWYSRGRVAAGLFDYDTRGILDRGHLRFFTRRSMRRMLANAGLTAVQWETTGVTGLPDGRIGDAARRIESAARRVWPTMFAFQFVVLART